MTHIAANPKRDILASRYFGLDFSSDQTVTVPYAPDNTRKSDYPPLKKKPPTRCPARSLANKYAELCSELSHSQSPERVLIPTRPLQVQDSGAGDDRADERPRGTGSLTLPVGHGDRQLRLRAFQESEPVVLGDGFRGVHRVASCGYGFCFCLRTRLALKDSTHEV